MVTIGLDEYGHFINDENKLTFVAGFIYKGDDYEDEKDRIIAFLQAECLKLGISFPEDMHLNYNASNISDVSLFERNIGSTLKRYFVDNGKYHLTCIIRSRRQRKEYKNISNIVDDDKANNLYEHMICSLLNNILFDCLDLMNENKVHIEIPTRVTVIEHKDKARIDGFIDLGYAYKIIKKQGVDHYLFYSSDQKTFKAAMSSRIMSSKRKSDIAFDTIHVESINYNCSDINMAYLYLADIVCNEFKRKFVISYQDYNIEKVYKWALEFTGNKPFIWAYDDIDQIYAEIIDKFINNDFIDVLMKLFDAKEANSDFQIYYNAHWFNDIEVSIRKCFDDNQISTYIEKLDSYYTCENINYKKGIFVLDKLWDIIESDGVQIKPEMKYRLADIGVRAYNHIGCTSDTNPYSIICEDLKDSIPVEEYLGTVTRIIQMSINEFDFDKAIEKQQYSLKCHEMLKRARENISHLYNANEGYDSKTISRGRALSSLGQCYAFKKNEDSLTYFNNALTDFTKDDDNTIITISHILNFASDNLRADIFEKYAPKYFGEAWKQDKPQEYLNCLSAEMDTFNLYTYLKAINQLYINKIDDTFVERLQMTVLDNQNDYHHPWELIYKNIGLILFQKNRLDLAEFYMDKAIECVKNPGATIKTINFFTEIQKAYYLQNRELLFQAIENFKQYLRNVPKIESYFKDALEGNIEEIYNKLNEKFTFTYN